MCKGGTALAAGDEVWEADSDSDGGECQSDTDYDSDAPTAASPIRPKPSVEVGKSPLKIPEKVAAVPWKNSTTAATSIIRPGSTAVSMSQRPPAQAPAATKVPEGGLMGLVSHLRADNTRLREALVTAQREMEAMAAEQNQKGSTQSVDFAHLLSLVKDFGEDAFYADDDLEADSRGGGVEVFAMNSPRGSEGSCASADAEIVEDCENDEVNRLRAELERSRNEVAQLEKALAERDIWL
eukprot:TRINITY_DN3829_c0_g1_i1.p1 TRINITY_DN3829_c0_g1~~TRINITY_DN3829_c0_g1_i1.p1  ORF type:complete len:239 (-),score=63.04 TRINITY_DN3829_c0_g1_i1:488-1204(-)